MNLATEAKIIPREILKVLPQIPPFSSAIAPETFPLWRIQRPYWSDKSGCRNTTVIGGAQWKGRFKSKCRRMRNKSSWWICEVRGKLKVVVNIEISKDGNFREVWKRICTTFEVFVKVLDCHYN